MALKRLGNVKDLHQKAHPSTVLSPTLLRPSTPKHTLSVVDCLNHGGSAGASGTLALGSSSWAVEGERTINFVTTRPVAAGEQVLWTYGDRSSEDFFVYHGFVLPGNPNEEVVLWGGVAELAAWFGDEVGGGTAENKRRMVEAAGELCAHGPRAVRERRSRSDVWTLDSIILQPSVALYSIFIQQRWPRKRRLRWLL